MYISCCKVFDLCNQTRISIHMFVSFCLGDVLLAIISNFLQLPNEGHLLESSFFIRYSGISPINVATCS